jgi:hypothetical protein
MASTCLFISTVLALLVDFILTCTFATFWQMVKKKELEREYLAITRIDDIGVARAPQRTGREGSITKLQPYSRCPWNEARMLSSLPPDRRTTPRTYDVSSHWCKLRVAEQDLSADTCRMTSALVVPKILR